MSVAPSPPRTGWGEHNARMRTAAVARGVEPTYDGRKRCLLVPSRSVSRRHYEVRIEGMGGWAKVTCNCPAGVSPASTPLGSTPCHHGAVGCLAMERAGLLAWDGSEWVMTTHPSPRTALSSVRNPCAACGEEVDPMVEIPVERQASTDIAGRTIHRGCR